MAKYVDDNNLLYLWQKIKNELGKKVNTADGMGLSEANFTQTEKNKLAGIAQGAQVNKLEYITVDGVQVPMTGTTGNINLSAYAKKSDITKMYRVKGNFTWAELIAKTDAEVGDVYNVTDQGGANYVCIVEKTAGAASWDKLGDIVDLSIYDTSEQVDEKISKVPAFKVLETRNINLYELENGAYLFKKSDNNYVLYYKADTPINSDGQGDDLILFIGDHPVLSYDTNDNELNYVAKSFMIFQSRYDQIVYGYAHAEHGIVSTFTLKSNYVDTYSSNLEYYYTKTNTYNKTEVDNKIKVVDDKINAFTALTNEEIDTIVNG